MNKRILLALLVLLVLVVAYFRPGRAEAYQPRVCWNHPLTLTNGQAISPSAIEASRIRYGTCNGYLFGTEIYQYVLQGNKNCVTAPNLQPGAYCYQVKSKVLNVEGWSDWSLSTPESKIIIQSSTCGSGCHG